MTGRSVSRTGGGRCLAAADRGARAEGGVPADRPAREEDDDRRAHVESADLVSARELGGVEVPAPGPVRARKVGDRTGPRGLDATDEEGAHHDDREGPPVRAAEVEDDSFVAREEVRYPHRGGGVHAEPVPGDVYQGGEGAVDRKVDAVVIARREIDGGRGAAGKCRSGLPVPPRRDSIV